MVRQRERITAVVKKYKIEKIFCVGKKKIEKNG